MKAIVLQNYGSAADVRYQDVPTPVSAADQVRIRVHATAVNHIDIAKAAGAFRQFFPLPFPWTPGYDVAGVIDQIGEQVQGWQIGDEVYGASLHDGAYAEYIVLSPQAIARKPKTLSFGEAASVPVSAETAWQVLFAHAGLQKGQTVLIHGGAGTVGTYAVQLAHRAGARVIVTASLTDKILLESLGADEVLDYKGKPFETLVSQVDAVIDLVGGDIQRRSYSVIKQNGVLISVNQPTSDELTAKYHVHGIFSQLAPSTEGLTSIAKLIDEGDLTINMGNVYPIAQTADAWKELLDKSSHKKGRIVLQIQ
jgi:NADPH:quinone reductase-like Zn-dependent oxidoreductase